MIVFWIVAALLIAAALLFLLPPLAQKKSEKDHIRRKELNVLLFKDQVAELQADVNIGTITQEQFDQAKQDLERSLLEDVSGDESTESVSRFEKLGNKTAIAVAVIVPVAAITLYQYLGSGESGLRPEEAQIAQRTEGHEGTLEEQIRKLQEHLQTNPDDMEGWTMLARSYYFLKNYQAASETFGRVASMTNEADPNVLADYADALAMAQGRNMQGRPYELVKKALQVEPFHQKALWLAGTAAYQVQDYPAALQYWEKLITLFPEGTDGHTQMLRNIAEIKQLMGEELDPEMLAKLQTQQQAAQSGAAQSSGDAANASVSGKVSLDPSLADSVSPSDTVFIFARAANGPRMPLAILKKQVSDLPIEFVMDDSDAMNPQMKLSRFNDIVVSARISKTGNAMPQPDDLQGSSDVIKVGAQGLNIVINQSVGAASNAASAGSATPVSSQSSTSAATVGGVIKLDPTLSSRVSPEDTLYVFARAAEGPRMPLAIIRKQVKDLPLAFALDDSMAMNPSMKLSNYSEIVVGARISKTGNAMPQSGDLKGSSSVIKLGNQDLKIIIDSAVP
ncbi:MAG: c-type cytochrome biogenesis protein CcmI [Gammaproteobacteria bacterium]|jgi:cytochrome c-type biogenesis protein CcmH|nr:c-type cytochrome biogenesis protein CcmI [Gammaproteobacteria bacterium]